MYTKMNLRGVSIVIARQKLSSLLLQHTHSLRNQHVLETKKKSQTTTFIRFISTNSNSNPENEFTRCFYSRFFVISISTYSLFTQVISQKPSSSKNSLEKLKQRRTNQVRTNKPKPKLKLDLHKNEFTRCFHRNHSAENYPAPSLFLIFHSLPPCPLSVCFFSSSLQTNFAARIARPDNSVGRANEDKRTRETERR